MGRCQVHVPEEIRVHPCVVRKAVEAVLSATDEGSGARDQGSGVSDGLRPFR